jgi:hypothetical protein
MGDHARMSEQPSSDLDTDGAGDMLSVRDAAAQLGVSPDTVRAHLRQGTLAGEKIDNKWVVYLDRPHGEQGRMARAKRSAGQVIARARAVVQHLRERLRRRSTAS